MFTTVKVILQLTKKKISYYKKENRDAQLRLDIFYFGWGTWIRTKELSGSEPDALPLGYTPIMGLV